MVFVTEIVASLMMGMLGAAQPAVDLQGDAPIDVTANRCEVLDVEDIVDCQGTVRVTQGDTILTADHMKIYGAGKGDGFDRIECDGNVRYAAGPNAVSAQRAEYDGKSTTITAVGDVVVIQGTQVMTGGKLVYNTTTKAMVFTPGQDGRVRGLFNTASTEQ